MVTAGYRPGEPGDGASEVRGILVLATGKRGEEAAPLAGVTGRPAGLYPVEERVTVAIEADLDHPLGVAACRSLAPELAAGARVVVCLAGFRGLFDSFAVSVGEH